MPTRLQTFPVKFEGGLVINQGRIEQGLNMPGSATDLINYEPDIEGGYTKILGYAKFDTNVVPGSGQIHGVITLSKNEALVCRNLTYQYSTKSGWTSKQVLSLTPTRKLVHSEYKWTSDRKTIIVDGTNNPVFFNHTTKVMSSMASPPTEVIAAQRVIEFKNHLFFAKNNYLTFTAPYSESDFNTGNGGGQVNIGDDITGLISFREQLFIFCKNSIYRLSGSTSDNFVLSPVTQNTGCLYGDTIQEVGGDIMYLASDGVRYLSASERENDFGLTRASDAIQNKVITLFRNNSNFSSVTIARKNQYRLFSFSSNPSLETLSYLATKFSNQSSEMIAWSELQGFKCYDVSKYQDEQDETILFVSDTSYVYQMELGNSFDGVNIKCVFKTPFMPITDPLIRKTYYTHTLYTKTKGIFSLFVQPEFDYGAVNVAAPPSFEIKNFENVSLWNNFDWNESNWSDSNLNLVEFKTNLVGSFFTMSLTYTEESSNPNFNINFMILEYRENDRR